MRFLLAALLVGAVSIPALAQDERQDQSVMLRCYPSEWAAKRLLSEHGELPIARALDNDGWLVELYAAEDGTTWTLMVSPSPDKTCFFSSGQAWQPLNPVWELPEEGT